MKNESQSIIWSPIILKEPNESILIYTGKIQLRGYNDLNFEVDGVITFNWFPRARPVLKGSIEMVTPFSSLPDFKFNALINGDLFGECYVVSSNFKSEAITKLNVECFFHGDCVIGDKSVAVDQIEFGLPNMNYIFGRNVEFILENGKHGSVNGRNVFTTDDYELTIDALPKCDEQIKKLKTVGGFTISYGGKICKTNNQSITYKESHEVLEAFGVFLSFLNCGQVHIMFPKGVFNGETIWQGYKDSHVKPYKNQLSWLDEINPNGIHEMWKNFYVFWKSSDENREALRAAINWYLEAIGGSGYIEGGIMMSQTALELLYNWILIDTRKILIGSDASNINAANKIRLLLAQLGISTEVPAHFEDAKNFVSQNTEIEDAPDLIVQIRNAIVHAQLEKRKKLIKIPAQVKYGALIIGIWYIELSILYMLKYNGQYNNRTAPFSLSSQDVPWKKT